MMMMSGGLRQHCRIFFKEISWNSCQVLFFLTFLTFSLGPILDVIALQEGARPMFPEVFVFPCTQNKTNYLEFLYNTWS